MPLMQVFVALIVVGVLLWLVNRFIPMAGSIKSILNAVVVICTVLWLLDLACFTRSREFALAREEIAVNGLWH